MPRRPTSLVALLALGAALLVAWFLLGGDGPPPGTPHLDGPDAVGTANSGARPVAGHSNEALTSAPPDAEALARRRPREGRPDPRRDRLDGRVVGADRTPLAGATVTLHERETGPAWTRRGAPPGPAVLTTTTGTDGAFELRPLPPGGAWQVLARAPGHAPGFAEAPGPGAFLEVQLAAAGTLVLTVVDGEGTALADAAVVHTTPEGSLATMTDDTGRARFDTLPTGVGQLKVAHPRYRVHTDPFLAVEPGVVLERTVVLEGAGALRGRVVADDDERPLADAEVVVAVPTAPTLPPADAVRTDGEGRFEAPDLAGPRDRIELRVRRAGYAEARLLRSATDESEILVRLRRGERVVVRGTVYTQAGEPVSGAAVRVGSASGAPDEDEVQTRTDPRGGFEVRLPPWAGPGTVWQARAEGAGGQAGVAAFVLSRESGAPAPFVEVLIGPTGGVIGRVVDAQGQAAVGAEVRLESDGGGAAAPARLLLRTLERDGTSLVAISDADGAFEFLGLPVAGYRLVARRGAVVAVHPEAFSVTAGDLVTIEVRLVDGPRIAGRVVGGAGEPLAGVYVRATPETGSPSGVERAASTRTDAAGAFVLSGLLDGAYRLGLTRPGHRQVGGGTRVTAGTQDLELRMEARGIVALALRDGGRPYEGVATVEMQGERGRGTSGFDGSGMDRAGPRTLRTDDGRLSIEDVDPGTWRVRVHTPAGGVATSRGTFEVVGGQTVDVDLDLKRGASLSGRVVDPGAAGPAATAWVQAWPWREDDGSTLEGEATRGSVRADAQGRYSLAGLGPGRYLVGVWTRDGAQWSAEVRLREGEERRLDLVREAPGQIDVRVRDAEGRAVDGARITLERAGGGSYVPSYQAMSSAGLIQDPADWAARLSTDLSGYVEIPLVPPGTWRIVPVKPGWTIAGTAPTVVLGAGGRGTAEVVLEVSKAE